VCVCEGVRVWCEGMWVGRGAISKFESVSVQFYLSLFSFPSPFFFSTLLPLPFYRSFFPPLPPPQATHHVRLDSLAIGRPSLVDVLAHTIRPNKRDGSNGRVITDEINSYAHTHEERRGKDSSELCTKQY